MVHPTARESERITMPSEQVGQCPLVLVMLDTNSAWSRGILRGFTGFANERGWTVLHYRPDANVSQLVAEWKPSAVVIGPESERQVIDGLAIPIVSVNSDRSAAGIPSVCLDDNVIANLAAEHLLATGLKNLTTVRLGAYETARARALAFEARARAANVLVPEGWSSASGEEEKPFSVMAWLRALPKPCGIFTCTDRWGRTIARYAQLAGLRIPEDVALIGVDNDTLECELAAPPLSSVLVPWRDVGERAAQLVLSAMAGKDSERRSVISPLNVVARRSSDVLAVDDDLVAEAVAWIRANAERRLTVGMVVAAVGSGRQRLERAFRRVLDRTIQEEIRRSHVDVARRLLETTRADLVEIARRSGFTNATLLNLAFQRELGTAPGAYRRQMLKALSSVRE